MGTCSVCNGQGGATESKSVTCDGCGGTGRAYGYGQLCIYCGGSGSITKKEWWPCSYCGGTGSDGRFDDSVGTGSAPARGGGSVGSRAPRTADPPEKSAAALLSLAFAGYLTWQGVNSGSELGPLAILAVAGFAIPYALLRSAPGQRLLRAAIKVLKIAIVAAIVIFLIYLVVGS